MPENILVHDSEHATLIEAYINASRKKGFELVGCEVPYNYYGNRGFIDVILKRTDNQTRTVHWLICEMKTKLCDVGGTIRQVKKAEQFFFKDKEKDIVDRKYVNLFEYPLVLKATSENYDIYTSYRKIFKDIKVMFFDANSSIFENTESRLEILKAIKECQRNSPVEKILEKRDVIYGDKFSNPLFLN